MLADFGAACSKHWDLVCSPDGDTAETSKVGNLDLALHGEHTCGALVWITFAHDSMMGALERRWLWNNAPSGIKSSNAVVRGEGRPNRQHELIPESCISCTTMPH